MKARFTTTVSKHEEYMVRSMDRPDKRGLTYYLPIVLLITLFTVIIVEVFNA